MGSFLLYSAAIAAIAAIVFVLPEVLAETNQQASTERVYYTKLGNALFNRKKPSSSSINEFFDSLEKNSTKIDTTTTTVTISTAPTTTTKNTPTTSNFTTVTKPDSTTNCVTEDSSYKTTAVTTDKVHTGGDVEEDDVREIYKKLKESIEILKEVLAGDISKTSIEIRSVLKNHMELLLVKTQKLRTLSKEVFELLIKA